MLKVLYVVSHLGSSGPTTQLYNIIKYLDREKINPVILTILKENEKSKADDFKPLDVPMYSLNLSYKSCLQVSKKRIRKAILPHNADIVHSSSFIPSFIVSKIKNEINHVETIRNFIFEDSIYRNGLIKGLCISAIYIFAMLRTKTLVCCSHAIKEKYRKFIKKDFKVIQNGFNFNSINVNNTDKTELRHKLGLDKCNKIYLSVGILCKRKDPITLLQAFKNSSASKTGTLIMLGDGKLMEQCKMYECDNILILGHVNNIFDYYNVSDVFISASKSEGLPNVVLEAGSIGLHMILSSIPEHKEVFHNNEEMDGITFFNVGDVKSCEEALTQSADKPVNRSLEISNHIKTSFNAEQVSKNYTNLYYSLAGETK